MQKSGFQAFQAWRHRVEAAQPGTSASKVSVSSMAGGKCRVCGMSAACDACRQREKLAPKIQAPMVDSKDQWWAFRDAARRGDVQELTRRMRQGIDINSRSAAGKTALILASSEAQVDCALCLVEAGALVNLQDRDGWSAAHWAAYKGHTWLCQILLAAGADVSLLTSDRFTPLALSISQGRMACSLLLLDGGSSLCKGRMPNVTVPERLIVYQSRLATCQSACLAIQSIFRKRGAKDLIPMVCDLIWATRDSPSWNASHGGIRSSKCELQ